MQLAGQNLHNEHVQCDMRGDINLKTSDSSDPFVYFLFCGWKSPVANDVAVSAIFYQWKAVE